MKILLLMDNRGDRNWGSQATTRALVRLLEERFSGSTLLSAPRTMVDPGKFWRKRSEAWAPAATRADYRSLRDRFALSLITRDLAPFYEAADLVVLNGEGTLHPQRQIRRWLPAIDFLQRKHRKRLWVVNSTIESTGTSEAWLFERVLKHAERVVVRDTITHAQLPVPNILGADCAYLTSPQPFNAPVSGDYAVLTGTAAIGNYPPETLPNAVAALRAEGLQVIFTASDRRDFGLPEQFGLDLPTITDREAGPEQLMGLQAGAKILVGGRYHPTILAALAGTPFVSLTSNTFKTQALMSALDAEPLLVAPDDTDQLAVKIKAVLSEREAWSQRVRTAAEAQRPLARLNVFDAVSS